MRLIFELLAAPPSGFVHCPLAAGDNLKWIVDNTPYDDGGGGTPPILIVMENSLNTSFAFDQKILGRSNAGPYKFEKTGTDTIITTTQRLLAHIDVLCQNGNSDLDIFIVYDLLPID